MLTCRALRGIELRLRSGDGGFKGLDALIVSVVQLRVSAAAFSGHPRALAFLRTEVWATVPADQRGRRLTRKEEDEILGYGPEGA